MRCHPSGAVISAARLRYPNAWSNRDPGRPGGERRLSPNRLNGTWSGGITRGGRIIAQTDREPRLAKRRAA